MGSGASTTEYLTDEDKQIIIDTLKEKLIVNSNDNNDNNINTIQLYDEIETIIKTQVNQAHSRSNKSAHKVTNADDLLPADNNNKKHQLVSSSSSSKKVNFISVEETGESDESEKDERESFHSTKQKRKQSASFRKHSHHFITADYEHDTDLHASSKSHQGTAELDATTNNINEYIEQMKSGSLTTRTSEFRSRRLTFDNKPIVAGQPSSSSAGTERRMSTRLNLYASTEMGVVSTTTPPFHADRVVSLYHLFTSTTLMIPLITALSLYILNHRVHFLATGSSQTPPMATPQWKRPTKIEAVSYTPSWAATVSSWCWMDMGSWGIACLSMP